MYEKKERKQKAADSLYALQERCVQCCFTSLYRFLELHHVLSMGLKKQKFLTYIRLLQYRQFVLCAVLSLKTKITVNVGLCQSILLLWTYHIDLYTFVKLCIYFASYEHHPTSTFVSNTL